jgi:hypothetical protein
MELTYSNTAEILREAEVSETAGFYCLGRLLVATSLSLKRRPSLGHVPPPRRSIWLLVAPVRS